MKPKRIQRKRTKGWRMPPNTVYVGRPSKFGNPFKPNSHRTKKDCVHLFWKMLAGHIYVTGEKYEAKMRILASLYEIKGKNLACWCRLDEPCHADVLLELANQL